MNADLVAIRRQLRDMDEAATWALREQLYWVPRASSAQVVKIIKVAIKQSVALLAEKPHPTGKPLGRTQDD